jgi:hypothetical protein
LEKKKKRPYAVDQRENARQRLLTIRRFLDVLRRLPNFDLFEVYLT